MDNDNYIRFQYSQIEHNGESNDFDYTVKLISTNCNYGGKRWWFKCPLIKDGIPCNRRVGVLYKQGDYFGCRHCHDLTYSSKKENRNSIYFSLFKTLLSYKKIEEIQKTMKRDFYAGKPTRKLKRIMKLYEQTKPHSDLLKKEKTI